MSCLQSISVRDDGPFDENIPHTILTLLHRNHMDSNDMREALNMGLIPTQTGTKHSHTITTTLRTQVAQYLDLPTTLALSQTCHEMSHALLAPTAVCAKFHLLPSSSSTQHHDARLAALARLRLVTCTQHLTDTLLLPDMTALLVDAVCQGDVLAVATINIPTTPHVLEMACRHPDDLCRVGLVAALLARVPAGRFDIPTDILLSWVSFDVTTALLMLQFVGVQHAMHVVTCACQSSTDSIPAARVAKMGLSLATNNNGPVTPNKQSTLIRQSMTCIRECASRGHINMVRLLCKHVWTLFKPSPHIVATPLITAAAHSGLSEMSKVMIDEFHIPHSVVELEAKRLLHWAAKRGNKNVAVVASSLLDYDSAGGVATASALEAARRGHNHVVQVLRELQRNTSQFSSVGGDQQITIITLNDHVLERICCFLNVQAVARLHQSCRRMFARERARIQLIFALKQDYFTERLRRLGESRQQTTYQLTRLAVAKCTVEAHREYETKCKAEALNDILARAVTENWPDVGNIVDDLAFACIAGSNNDHDDVTGDNPAVLDLLLKLHLGDGDVAITFQSAHRLVDKAVLLQRVRCLTVLLRVCLSDRRVLTHYVVLRCREAAEMGRTQVVSCLIAGLSREALHSRRVRDAENDRGRAEWERRGMLLRPGVAFPGELLGPTEAEQDLDASLRNSLCHAARHGHAAVCSMILNLLRARLRMEAFTRDFQAAATDAARAGHVEPLKVLLPFLPHPEEAFGTAARNGQMDVCMLLSSGMEVRDVCIMCVEAARRDQIVAVQTYLKTGKVTEAGARVAWEEANRRGFEDVGHVLKVFLGDTE